MIVQRAFAVGGIVLIASLGLAGSGEAQSGPSDSIIQTQATVQAVDCDGQQVTLSSAGATSTAQSTLGSVVHVNGAAAPFCSLSSYIGAPATAWVMARGGQIVLVRLDVTSTVAPGYPASPQPSLVPAFVPSTADPSASAPGDTSIPYTPIPPQPASAPSDTPVFTPPAYTPPPSAPAPSYAPSAAAIVLGTVLVGGIVYLLVRSTNGSLYRYPYYHMGYSYRPYVGPYTTAPAYDYGPYRRCRDGGWNQWCR